jgi:hypothetical protein
LHGSALCFASRFLSKSTSLFFSLPLVIGKTFELLKTSSNRFLGGTAGGSIRIHPIHFIFILALINQF